ncbi:MAG: hypothetical protein JWP63_1282, partial [Candidatus Solibacter sp.]|nr:hypothetical protein [Candidatus Solibacter sp.]
MRLNLAAVTLCCCTGLFAQRAASTRFVYAVSGKPAAGMTVETMGAQPGRYTTDGSGRIPVALGVGRVHVTDPQSGLMLLDTGIVSPSAELAIAIPIRLS